MGLHKPVRSPMSSSIPSCNVWRQPQPLNSSTMNPVGEYLTQYPLRIVIPIILPISFIFTLPEFCNANLTANVAFFRGDLFDI